MRMRIAVAVLLVSASTVRADGTFLEGDIGLMVPFADDEYEGNIDESLKLGVRFGSRSGPRALDLSIDFTPASDDIAFVEADLQRYRFMVGGRYEHPINPKTQIFVRGAAGIDVVRVSGDIPILDAEFSETDIGLALELSGGILFNIGERGQIGAKLGLPFAFHFDDDDPDDPDDIDLEYTGVDFDVLFVAGVKF